MPGKFSVSDTIWERITPVSLSLSLIQHENANCTEWTSLAGGSSVCQVMVQVLEVLSGCVRHVCSFEEAPALDSIRSLPSCILKVLRNTFHHCKVWLQGIHSFNYSYCALCLCLGVSLSPSCSYVVLYCMESVALLQYVVGMTVSPGEWGSVLWASVPGGRPASGPV